MSMHVRDFLVDPKSPGFILGATTSDLKLNVDELEDQEEAPRGEAFYSKNA